jgi:hypothetical protein
MGQGVNQKLRVHSLRLAAMIAASKHEHALVPLFESKTPKRSSSKRLISFSVSGLQMRVTRQEYDDVSIRNVRLLHNNRKVHILTLFSNRSKITSTVR